ncbi:MULTISPECIES: YybH family protein [Bradyrhizobium]|uniref:YybH family protein n=1 Tax=Bradyrhizobium elkanii TaxID=29448 RepID=UPI0004233B5A|nr:nuclear transport factor 2 family protein [Bradyrhizobium elkanii]
MSESFPLPTEPEGVVPSLIERLNSGKVSALIEMFDPKCVFVEDDGRTVTGHADITVRLERFVEPGVPLVTKVRHIFVADDIAQLVYDWWIDGTGRDGKEVHLKGTACDIVRRGADGRWRFIIDNNQGAVLRKPA